MEARKRKRLACTIASMFIVAMITAGITGDTDDQVKAGIQADNFLIVIIGTSSLTPTVDGNYTDLIASEQMLSYNLTLPPGSLYTLSELNISWSIQTSFGTTIFSYGSNMKYIFYETGDYTIAVTALAPDNSTSSKKISLKVLLDYDDDGIADWWERHWFQSTATASNTTDYDDDGWTDLEEFESQTNPIVKNFKPGFLDEFGWLIVLIIVILALIIAYLMFFRPMMKEKQKTTEQKKIAAAVDLEKTLMSLDEIEEKGKK